MPEIVHSVERNEQCQDPPDLARRDPLQVLDSFATTRRCHRGQEIYGQEDPAGSWYRVIAGMLRRFSVRADGRRQIMDFLLPGDFFGFANGHEHHGCSVEAVAMGTVVACYPRRRAEMLADSDPRIGQFIRQKAFDAIVRLQAQIRTVSQTRAPEKVGSFLLDMAARGHCGAKDKFVLPMSRYDIADYLAVSVETVSRAMTDLKDRGAIALTGTRRVTIINRPALLEAESDEWPRMSRAVARRDVANGNGKAPRDTAWRVVRSATSLKAPPMTTKTPPRGELRR
ncbi:MAG: hypothetical protein JWM53_2872 [bacterium]|nr:hypothetical protein [bacterium]